MSPYSTRCHPRLDLGQNHFLSRQASLILLKKKGYKGKQCEDKLCFVCDSTPPTLSPSIIRNLGSTFCNIAVDKLSDVNLQKKKKPHAPVGKGWRWRRSNRILIMVISTRHLRRSPRSESCGILTHLGRSIMIQPLSVFILFCNNSLSRYHIPIKPLPMMHLLPSSSSEIHGHFCCLSSFGS